MFSKDVGIDLGTANVLIYLKGKGVILNEPSVVAIDRNTKKVLAVGEAARQMIGRTPENIVAIRPLKDGVIHDFDITEAMLKYFIQKLKLRGFMSKPRVLVCCPSNITPVEQKAIRDAVVRAGGGEVFLEEEPKVAAIGAGMDIFQPSGNMVIDIGGGTADVAVLSMGEIVTAQSLRVAGDQFDQDIAAYIKKKYKLLVGERTAETLKMTIGSMILEDKNDTMDIRGRDMVTGLPKVISFTSEELLEAISDSVEMIIKAAKNVLEKTPPELSADIIDRGIMLTGGGALISGLDRRLTEELLVPVYVADNPMDCVVLGTGMILDNLNNVSKK